MPSFHSLASDEYCPESVLGVGTYDWIVSQQHAEDARHRKESEAKARHSDAALEKRRQKERGDWQKRMHEKQQRQGNTAPAAVPKPSPLSQGSSLFAETGDVEMARRSEGKEAKI